MTQMERVLNQKQVAHLSKLLQISGRTSTSYKRQALLYEIGYDPNQLEFHSGAAADFCLVLVGDLNQKGERKILERILGAISPYLPGRRDALLEIQRALVQGQRANPAQSSQTLKLLSNAIVRIRDAASDVVGTGFLIGDRHILTCVNVVVCALDIPEDAGPPGSAVELDFPLLDPERHFTAQVCHWQPDANVAGLRMAVERPSEAQAIRLVTSDELWGHPFRAFGFPAEYPDGVWASGVLRGRTASGWVQTDNVYVPGYWVQRGFSGAPVWDEQLEVVMGMVVAIDTDETVRVAHVIPADILAEAWPGAVRVNRVESLGDRETTERSGGGESGSVGIGDVHGDISNAIIAGRDVHLNVGSSPEPRAPISGLPTDHSALSRLRQVMNERFHQEELRTLCFDLGIDWDDLPARGKAGKVRELVDYFARRRSIEELIQFCERQRPDVSWRDIGKVPD